MMGIAAALEALGVRNDTLTADEKQHLDEQGYLPLPNILSAEQAREFRARLVEIAEAEGEQAGKEFHQEVGATRLSNLVNKDSRFEICFEPSIIFILVRHFLDDYYRRWNERWANQIHFLSKFRKRCTSRYFVF